MTWDEATALIRQYLPGATCARSPHGPHFVMVHVPVHILVNKDNLSATDSIGNSLTLQRLFESAAAQAIRPVFLNE